MKELVGDDAIDLGHSTPACAWEERRESEGDGLKLDRVAMEKKGSTWAWKKKRRKGRLRPCLEGRMCKPILVRLPFFVVLLGWVFSIGL